MLEKAKRMIIVALDVNSIEKAMELVNQLKEHAMCFKIGLQFMCYLMRTGKGPEFFEFMQKSGASLWTDMKLNDIPNTMVGAMTEITQIEPRPSFLTVHASASVDGMMDVVKSAAGVTVVGVTVLTSFEENDAHCVFNAPSKAKVLQFVRDCKNAGVTTIVCSPQETLFLRGKKELNDIVIINPGIRPEWAASGDQKRVKAPKPAILGGADYLVVGRPITQPPEAIGTPVDAFMKIAEEIVEAMKELGITEESLDSHDVEKAR
jgi:orotidine-5'-phosphate decarboxylase